MEAIGPLLPLVEFIQMSIKEADAVICDHKLTKGTYANFSGADAVAYFYKEKFPALLCTAYSKADLLSIRKNRQYIPVLIESDQVNPDNITKGFEICIKELKGVFSQVRKAWKVLVRVEEIYQDSKPEMFDVILPGWNSREIIRLPFEIVKREYRDRIKPETRFHAYVNKGAESQEDLYFKNFQFD